MEIILYSSNDLIEAKQIQDLLSVNGIQCYLKNEYTQNLFGDTRFLIGKDIIAGNIKIVILDSDYDKACQLIEDILPPDIENEREDEEIIGNGSLTSEDSISKNASSDHSIYQMIVFSVLSVLIIPAFLNIKNYKFFWIKNRNATIFSIILSLIMIPWPFIIIINNIYFGILLLFLSAFPCSINLLIKGYSRYKNKPDSLSFLYLVPFFLLFTLLMIALRW